MNHESCFLLQPAAMKEAAEEKLPPMLERLEAMMDGDYFVGSEARTHEPPNPCCPTAKCLSYPSSFQISHADLAVFHILEFLSMFGEANPMKKFAKLEAHSQRVASIPQIATWLQVRPKDDY